MKKNIITVKDLYVEGKMIAFIKGNRSVNSKNISRKKKSFEKFGMNLVPLMYVRSEERRVGKECRSRWSPYH